MYCRQNLSKDIYLLVKWSSVIFEFVYRHSHALLSCFFERFSLSFSHLFQSFSAQLVLHPAVIHISADDTLRKQSQSGALDASFKPVWLFSGTWAPFSGLFLLFCFFFLTCWWAHCMWFGITAWVCKSPNHPHFSILASLTGLFHSLSFYTSLCKTLENHFTSRLPIWTIISHLKGSKDTFQTFNLTQYLARTSWSNKIVSNFWSEFLWKSSEQ